MTKCFGALAILPNPQFVNRRRKQLRKANIPSAQVRAVGQNCDRPELANESTESESVVKQESLHPGVDRSFILTHEIIRLLHSAGVDKTVGVERPPSRDQPRRLP